MAPNVNKIEWSNNVMTMHFDNGGVVEYYDVPEGIAEACKEMGGSYMNNYVVGKFKQKFIEHTELEKLRHHKTTTVGLWATDRPDIIPEDLKKDYFFQIEY